MNKNEKIELIKSNYLRNEDTQFKRFDLDYMLDELIPMVDIYLAYGKEIDISIDLQRFFIGIKKIEEATKVLGSLSISGSSESDKNFLQYGFDVWIWWYLDTENLSVSTINRWLLSILLNKLWARLSDRDSIWALVTFSPYSGCRGDIDELSNFYRAPQYLHKGLMELETRLRNRSRLFSFRFDPNIYALLERKMIISTQKTHKPRYTGQ